MPMKEEDIRKAGMKARVLGTYDEQYYFYSEAVIPFGASVMRGTDPGDQCELMATGGKFLGVAGFRGVNVTDSREYAEKETVEVISKGYVWVEVVGAVVAGDTAAAGANGKFNKKGVSTYDDINGVFESSAGAGEYAILHLKG